jgi:hypothetical protein
MLTLPGDWGASVVQSSALALTSTVAMIIIIPFNRLLSAMLLLKCLVAMVYFCPILYCS